MREANYEYCALEEIGWMDAVLELKVAALKMMTQRPTLELPDIIP